MTQGERPEAGRELCSLSLRCSVVLLSVLTISRHFLGVKKKDEGQRKL
jgi:hypothetical protein